MYSRERGDETYTFEASGGLLHAGLVMMDRETDSHWSILTEEAIYGPAQGQRLEQVPGSIKTTWGDWKRRHPQTRVLSVEGREHEPHSPYDPYFASEEGFRQMSAKDERLADKEAVYGFHWQGEPYVVPHALFREGGAVVPLGERQLFLFRQADDSFYRSTVALLAAPGATFVAEDGGWRLAAGEETRTWNGGERRFDGGEPLAEVFSGFDTFWYIWSLSNPGTEVLPSRPPTG